MATIEKDPAAKASAVAARSAGAKVSEGVAKAADRASEMAAETEDDLEDRFAELREQVKVMRDQFEAYAGRRMHDIRDTAAETLHQGGRAVRAAGRQATAVGVAVRHDPLPTIVGLGVIAALTALVVAGRRQ